MSERGRKGGEGGGRHGERQKGDSKMEVKPPIREAGDGPTPTKEGRERYSERRYSAQRGRNNNQSYNDDRNDRRGGSSTSGRPSGGKEGRGSFRNDEDKNAAKKQQKEEEERKKREEEQRQEEEKRKAEEEQKRKEEEARKKEEEDAEKARVEELKTLEEFVNECREKAKFKTELREANIASADNRPDESFFTRLDSSLKKNTAFVKKLRLLSESQKDSLAKDFNGLNLSKYVEEAASAISEAKLKMSDVQTAVYLCSLIHQRYADFAPFLLENFQKNLLNKKDEGKISNPSKYRVDLRFFGELVSVGLFRAKEGLSVLASQLQLLVAHDREEHAHLSILTSFCRHCGDDYMGLLPRKIRLLAEKHGRDIPRSEMLPPERQKACRNLLKEYFSSLIRHVTNDHQTIKGMERQNRKILQTKGELTQERRDNYESAYNAFHKLHTSASALADLLDEDMPEFPAEESSEDGGGTFDIFNPLKDAEFQYEGDTNLFEDDDTRCFYENLPDLRALVPGILYKDSEHSSKEGAKEADPLMEEDLGELEVEEVEKEIETARIEESMKDADTTLTEDDNNPELAPEPEEEDMETGTLMKQQFDAYLLSLPTCVNRDLIDKAAIEFCMNFNTKVNRKKLVRTLFTVHRTRYDLLPFYARLVATLSPCMPDVATDLVHNVKSDLRWHMRKKDQINIESKLKTVRYLGELVKFNMCPKSEALHSLKMLMFDFSHHNIEMACALLETCGRFLYRSPDSHYRTKVYLDVMMRKKTALSLDSRYETMIENAYFYSNPPENPQSTRVERPPMHNYIRRLLYKDLSKITTEKVLRQMRKLNWDDSEIAFYATKCLTAVWNIRFNSVHCAANLLAGIAPYHEHVAIQVVDGVLEDIRLGMEVNHPRYNQRRVSCIKYLGELYNYRMVESAVIFRVLYSLITFGVSLDEVAPHPLDPPEHLFRLRLVCVLLDTCGQYFDKGSSKKKLDCFLVYFQRYYWFKRSLPAWSNDRPFPIDIMNMMRDTMDAIRPKMMMCASWQDALAAVTALEEEYKAKISGILPTAEEEETEAEEEGLSTILENEEEEELSQGLSQVRLTDGSGTQDSDPSQEEDCRPHVGSHSHSGEGEEGEGEDDAYDEEEEEEDDNDVLDSAGEDEHDDQVTLLSKPKFMPTSEDNDFMAAFDKMMAENIQSRTQESLKVPQLDIAVPMHLRGKNKKAVTCPSSLGGPATPAVAVKEENTVSFVLMTRRGNKQQLTNLDVPITEGFATKFREREEAERMEKERMKQMVLNIHERQEEEDYQEMLASLNRSPPTNQNRERRVRYQHPKGAPDADLIFGSGPK
ncbi:regulator of nonsense transcripts 2-like isoform X2 [Babylonia areolata]|uniref:regulator of nonsense transcripts 2-like isoform X2 n=1 Tax=Babylonia areolata TaxID=304850 RepID=UPI003FCFCD4B